MLTEPKLTLAKTSDANSQAEGMQQNVVVEGRMLMSRSAFVGHSFLPQDKEIVLFIKDILKEMQVNCSTGEKAEATQIQDKVKRRIKAADFFVGIFTRREKIEGKDLWTTTEWVQEEMSFAAANAKRVVIIREEGIADFGGMQGPLEYIEFGRKKLHEAAIKLMQTLWSLNPGTFTFNTNGPPEMSLDILRAAVEANPDEPALRVALAESLKQNGHVKGAIDEIEVVLEAFPDFPAALSAKVEYLRACGKKPEAKQLCQELLLTNPNDANVRHKLAHILAELGGSKDAEREFERAADCQPTDPRHLKCHIELLLRTGSKRRSKLEKAMLLCEDVSELGGKAWEEQVSKLKQAISTRLSKIQSTNKPPARKGRNNIR